MGQQSYHQRILNTFRFINDEFESQLHRKEIQKEKVQKPGSLHSNELNRSLSIFFYFSQRYLSVK